MSDEVSEGAEAQESADFQPQSLSTIFAAADEAASEEKSEAPAPEGETQPQADTQASEDDTGEKEADSAPESDKSESDSHTVPLAVMMKERDGRKSERARADRLEAEMKALKEGDTKRPSVFDNEEEFVSHIESRATQMAENRFFAMSEKLAVDSFGEEVVSTAMERLAEIVQTNPQLAVRFKDSASPYHEAVKIVEEQEKVQAALDGTLEEQAREAGRKEALNEKAKQSQESEESEIPSSLAAVGSTGVGAGSNWQGPTPISKALQ